MRNAVVLLCVMLGAAAPLAALDAYPKTTLAEDATATWCGYCPDAYAGLDVVHSSTTTVSSLSARYYATTGGSRHCGDRRRARLLRHQRFPTVVFNGLTKVGRRGAGIATGGPVPAIVGPPTSSRRRSGSRSTPSTW